jgi:preprotein translocase subunit Sss1
LTDAGERVATFLEEMEQITALAETPDGEHLLFET